MRGLFLLMIAVNLAYFAWEGGYGPRQGAPSGTEMPAAAGAGGTLTLLSEAPEALPSRNPAEAAGDESSKAAEPHSPSKTPSPPTAKKDPAATSSPGCYRIAGFREKIRADAVTAVLRQNGARLSGRGASQVSRSNHWVMIPPAESRAAAGKIVKELQVHGMNDFYLVRSGEYENAISLGVFSTEAAALQRLKRIRALSLSGPEPGLDRMELTAKRYWIEIQWPASEDSSWKQLVPENLEVEVAPTPCRSPR